MDQMNNDEFSVNPEFNMPRSGAIEAGFSGNVCAIDGCEVGLECQLCINVPSVDGTDVASNTEGFVLGTE